MNKKTKKAASLLLLAGLTASFVVGCGNDNKQAQETPANTDQQQEEKKDLEKIIVGASPSPHAEILEVAKDALAEKGYELEIVTFTDYVQPNNVVDSGDVDANYFQHLPYLEDFNAQNGTHVVSVAAIHVEPMGLYGGKQTTLDALQ